MLSTITVATASRKPSWRGCRTQNVGSRVQNARVTEVVENSSTKTDKAKNPILRNRRHAFTWRTSPKQAISATVVVVQWIIYRIIIINWKCKLSHYRSDILSIHWDFPASFGYVAYTFIFVEWHELLLLMLHVEPTCVNAKKASTRLIFWSREDINEADFC